MIPTEHGPERPEAALRLLCLREFGYQSSTFAVAPWLDLICIYGDRLTAVQQALCTPSHWSAYRVKFNKNICQGPP